MFGHVLFEPNMNFKIYIVFGHVLFEPNNKDLRSSRLEWFNWGGITHCKKFLLA